MELVRELRSSTDDEYGYVALDAKDNALHVVFRGSCTLGNVLTDLNYEDQHGVAQRQYVAHLTGGRAAGGHAAGGHAARGHAARGHAARGHAARDVDVAREMILHRGFAEAYLAIRHEMFEAVAQVMQQRRLQFALDQAAEEDGGRLRRERGVVPRFEPPTVHLTGHSMGGAMAMLAALELAHARTRGDVDVGTLKVMTFACPRLGNAAFVETFEKAFGDGPTAKGAKGAAAKGAAAKGGVAGGAHDEHWALVVPGDAVPHLPFVAWGFRHPYGTVPLGEAHPEAHCSARQWTRDAEGDAGANAGGDAGGDACEAALPPRRLTRVRDRGDSIEQLRPKDGDVMNWGICHDLNEYLHYLYAHVDSAVGAAQNEGDHAPSLVAA